MPPLLLLLMLLPNADSFCLSCLFESNKPLAKTDCSMRNHWAFSTVYDTVLEDKCSTKTNCSQQCTTVLDTKCGTRLCVASVTLTPTTLIQA